MRILNLNESNRGNISYGIILMPIVISSMIRDGCSQ